MSSRNFDTRREFPTEDDDVNPPVKQGATAWRFRGRPGYGKRPKFGNKPQVIKGKRQASKLEAQRYKELLLLESLGHIRDLDTQVNFYFIAGRATPEAVANPKILTSGACYESTCEVVSKRFHYRLDFRYFDTRREVWVYEDTKGFRTKEYNLKRALIEASYGITITEVTK